MNKEDDERQESRETCPGLPRLAPPDAFDPVIEAYKKDVDRTLIRENLKLSHRQRLKKLEKMAAAMIQWHGTARRTSSQAPGQER